MQRRSSSRQHSPTVARADAARIDAADGAEGAARIEGAAGAEVVGVAAADDLTWRQFGERLHLLPEHHEHYEHDKQHYEHDKQHYEHDKQHHEQHDKQHDKQHDEHEQHAEVERLLNANDMAVFGSSPLGDGLRLVRCLACARPLVPHAVAEHVARCPGSHANGTTTSATKRNMHADRRKRSQPKQLHRRPSIATHSPAIGSDDDDDDDADEDDDVPFCPHGDGPYHALVRDAHHQSNHHSNALYAQIDLNSHCAVITPAGPCTRPLSCKLHSMYAKSTVPRPMGFAAILRAYQDKFDAARGILPSASAADTKDAARMDDDDPLPKVIVEEHVVDADPAIDALYACLTYKQPRPIAHANFVSIKQRTRSLRMRDYLIAALTHQRAPSWQSYYHANKLQMTSTSSAMDIDHAAAHPTQPNGLSNASIIASSAASSSQSLIHSPAASAASMQLNKSIPSLPGTSMPPASTAAPTATTGKPAKKAPKKKAAPGTTQPKPRAPKKKKIATADSASTTSTTAANAQVKVLSDDFMQMTGLDLNFP